MAYLSYTDENESRIDHDFHNHNYRLRNRFVRNNDIIFHPFKHLENTNVILRQPQVEEVKDFEIIKNPSFNNYYEF